MDFAVRLWFAFCFFFFQAEDGIRDLTVTGVQTCALPICWFQNGQVQRYLVALVIGGAALVFFATRPGGGTDFYWEQTGELTVVFEADLGGGPGSSGAVVEFDFDGDSVADHTETWNKGDDPVLTQWQFTRPGAHTVTMRVKDAVFEKQGEVTHTVRVEETRPAEGAAAATGAASTEVSK